MLSGTEGLKSNSIEHRLLEGTNLVAEVPNRSAVAFLSLGMDTMLNALEHLSKSHTSF